GAGSRVLAGEEDLPSPEVLRPRDVGPSGRIHVDLEDVSEPPVRPGHGRAEDAERADATAGRTVAVDRVGIQQDLVRGEWRVDEGSMVPSRVGGHRAGDLREADVPHARRIVRL